MRKYPNPNFTRDSVYQFWHDRAKAKWTSAIDEIISARNLLKKGAEPGGLGEYRVEEIPIEEPEGLSVLAFSLPDMLESWRDRIREVAMDSACTDSHQVPSLGITDHCRLQGVQTEPDTRFSPPSVKPTVRVSLLGTYA